jgi:signal transduction histidine kinase
VLSTLALAPVTRLRRAVEAIAIPGARVGVPRAHDEIAELAETMNAMLGRLDAASERERRFVDDASHELRTPLALIKAELDVALRGSITQKQYEGVLADAVRDIDGLIQLADDLLLLARSDRGEVPLRVERIDTDALVVGIARRFARRAATERRGLSIDATSRELSGDPTRIQQALGNLFENALRYGTGEITLVAYPHADGTRIGVKDEGPGIAERDLAEAFRRFTRGDRARHTSGAGLGLAIVELIAKIHGGAVYSETRPGAFEIGIVIPVITAS